MMPPRLLCPERLKAVVNPIMATTHPRAAAVGFIIFGWPRVSPGMLGTRGFLESIIGIPGLEWTVHPSRSSAEQEIGDMIKESPQSNSNAGPVPRSHEPLSLRSPPSISDRNGSILAEKGPLMEGMGGKPST